MRRLLEATVTLALAVILVAGCGNGGSPSPAGSAFPTGTWTGTNELGEVATMEFRPGGTWTFTVDGKFVSQGLYETDATTLTFKTDQLATEISCPEQATYSWKHANDQLTLTKQTDPCSERVGLLDGSVWTPAK